MWCLTSSGQSYGFLLQSGNSPIFPLKWSYVGRIVLKTAYFAILDIILCVSGPYRSHLRSSGLGAATVSGWSSLSGSLRSNKWWNSVTDRWGTFLKDLLNYRGASYYGGTALLRSVDRFVGGIGSLGRPSGCSVLWHCGLRQQNLYQPEMGLEWYHRYLKYIEVNCRRSIPRGRFVRFRIPQRFSCRGAWWRQWVVQIVWFRCHSLVRGNHKWTGWGLYI